MSLLSLLKLLLLSYCYVTVITFWVFIIIIIIIIINNMFKFPLVGKISKETLTEIRAWRIFVRFIPAICDLEIFLLGFKRILYSLNSIVNFNDFLTMANKYTQYIRKSFEKLLLKKFLNLLSLSKWLSFLASVPSTKVCQFIYNKKFPKMTIKLYIISIILVKFIIRIYQSTITGNFFMVRLFEVYRSSFVWKGIWHSIVTK